MDILLVFGSFLAGICVHAAYQWQVQRAAFSHYMREKGARGNQKVKESSERLMSAIAEAAALYQSGKSPTEIGKELLPKYPDVAAQLAQKVLKGKLDGALGGLLGGGAA